LEEESYGSILRAALALARLLSPLTGQDEIVGVVMPNAAPTLALILGLSLSRRVPALLNYTAGPEGVRVACAAANIRTVLASRAFVEKAKLGRLLEELPGIRVIYLEDLKSRVGPLDKLWVLWHLLFPRAASTPQSPHEAAVVLFTSGSEGKPKGV